MTVRKMRQIANEWKFGYKAWRICEDHRITYEMLAAVLVETGIAKSIQDGRRKIRARG